MRYGLSDFCTSRAHLSKSTYLEEIVPSKSESEGRVDESRGVSCRRRGEIARISRPVAKKEVFVLLH